MAIVTMCTDSYLEWLYHFVKSLEGNTKEKILVNLVNVDLKKVRILRKIFPKVIFKNHKVLAEKKETNNVDGKAFKVTYLKGQFVSEAINKYNEPILWIDVTALIRKDLSEITDQLKECDVMTMRRNFKVDEGKAVYACEIFGVNSKTEAQRYKKKCNSDKSWFSDQIALCYFKGNIRNIEFGRWSNFVYEEEACSWSDRGKEGIGKVTFEDIKFTHEKFIEDLEKKIPNYREAYNKYLLKVSNKKILIHVDDSDWCYATTVNEIKKIPGYEITVIYSVGIQMDEVMKWQGDLVWGRCGSYRHKKLLDLRPDLKGISFSTITIGGELLFNRFGKQITDNKGEAGVIVQNQEAKRLLDHYNKKAENGMACFILPNGVNIKNFKPKKHSNKRDYIVGFAGRTKEPIERITKGIAYVDYCASMAGLEVQMVSNTTAKQVDFTDMPQFYQDIDLLILPSDAEGCSNTINEAMASGLPIIFTKQGWHGDVCKDEIYFVDRNVERIYQALEFFKDPQKRKEYGRRARKFAEQHSWEKMFKHYAKTFDKMILHAQKQVKPEPLPEKKPVIIGSFVKVRALDKVNLGKIDKNGPTLWFTKGMERQIPNDEKHMRIINEHVDARFLEIV